MKQSRIDLIMDGHRAACSGFKKRIEKEFPKLFEQKPFKNGDWIKLVGKGDILIQIVDLENVTAFGFSSTGRWLEVEQQRGWSFKSTPQNWIKAEPEHVKCRLIDEAKKRGYKDGNYECLTGDTEIVGEIQSYAYDSETDSLIVQGERYSDRNVVYERGEWAEVIKIPSDIQALLNKYGAEKITKYIQISNI